MKEQMYSRVHPISKTTPKGRTSHAGKLLKNQERNHKWRSPKYHSTWRVPLWKDQQEPTCSSSVQTQDVVCKTCWERWMIWTNGEREKERKSGKFMLAAQLHDINIYIYIYLRTHRHKAHPNPQPPYIYIYIYIYITFLGTFLNCTKTKNS